VKTLLRDSRVRRPFLANTTGSIGSGITIFAVPWLLVHRPDGNAAYRWVTLGTTLALFAFMPFYGAWIDRHSRKAMLLGSEAFGFFATLAMALLGLALGGFATWQLAAIYFCGMLYYTLHYPAKFAFIQQIFDRSQYQSLTGLLEIQGQAAMMAAGALGGLLVDRVPLWAILLADAATYAFSFAVQSTIPYEATHLATAHLSPATSTAKPSVWSNVAAGWAWLSARPQLNLFLTCSLLPFVALMTANYLFPIFVAQTLHAGPGYFAGGEIAFALGAMAAGAVLPRLLSRASADRTIPGTIVCFLIALIAILLFRHPAIYLVASVVLGFGNAGCRVARNTLMLHVVPNEVMGRVSIFYSVLDRLLRTLLVSAMVVVDIYGPPSGFLILFAVVALALAGVLASRRSVHESAVLTEALLPAPSR